VPYYILYGLPLRVMKYIKARLLPPTAIITATFSRICAASGEQLHALVRQPASLPTARPDALRPAA
jgi:hypothetical protein